MGTVKEQLCFVEDNYVYHAVSVNVFPHHSYASLAIISIHMQSCNPLVVVR